MLQRRVFFVASRLYSNLSLRLNSRPHLLVSRPLPTRYNRLTGEHAVRYDDGEYKEHPLWDMHFLVAASGDGLLCGVLEPANEEVIEDAKPAKAAVAAVAAATVLVSDSENQEEEEEEEEVMVVAPPEATTLAGTKRSLEGVASSSMDPSSQLAPVSASASASVAATGTPVVAAVANAVADDATASKRAKVSCAPKQHSLMSFFGKK